MLTLQSFQSNRATGPICLQELVTQSGKVPGLPSDLPDSVLISVAKDIRHLITSEPPTTDCIFAPQMLITWVIESILPEGVALEPLSIEKMTAALDWYEWAIEMELTNRVTGVSFGGEEIVLKEKLLDIYMRK